MADQNLVGLLPKQHINTGVLTVVETVYHRRVDANPTVAESHYNVILPTDESPYVRPMKITDRWARLDLGWIKQCSMLVITNEEGKNLQRVPTEEEKAATQAKVILLAVQLPEEGSKGRDMLSPPKQPAIWIPFAIIPPRESCRFTPLTDTIWIRCYSADGAKVTINAFPG